MKKHFEVEEITSNPKLVIVDYFEKENPFLSQITSHFSQKLSVYIFTKRKQKFENAQMLSSLSGYFFDKLREQVDYSLILFSYKQKEKCLDQIQKLCLVSTKVFVVIERTEAQSCLSEIEKIKATTNAGIILLGSVFGTSYAKEPFTKIIANSILKKNFVMPEDPLAPTFLVSQEDVLHGFEYLFFSTGAKNNVFPLYYKTPNTFTSLVHTLKLVEHELAVSYDKNFTYFIPRVSPDEVLEKKLGTFSETIRKIFTGFEKGVLEIAESKNLSTFQIGSKKKRSKKYSPLFKNINHALFLFIVSFGLFLAVSIGFLFLSFYYFQNSITLLQSGKFDRAFNEIQISKNILTYTKPQVSFVLSQADFISGSKTSTYLDTFSDAVVALDEIMQISKTENISGKDTDTIFANALILYFLSQNKIPKDVYSGSVFEKYLPLMNIFQEAAGFKKEMNYLVLFQNNNELRPTGGFIGSVATITIRNGKIQTSNVSDVYELDGQLTDHVEPHFVIRRFLQPHLYLRDSNFHPDFEMTASSAAQLYGLESGKEVDGVIAIDTEVLKTLIEIMGPVTIPGRREKVDKDTIISVLQDSIHDDFFPGSTEKKELLSAVFSKVVIGFENDPRKKISLLKRLPTLFSQKHIQISFNKDYLQRGVIAAGISGALKDLRIEKDILKDTISVNEANIGVNKVNEFVTRKVSVTSYLKEHELSSETLVEYKNSGKEDYVMYFRQISPKDSLIEGIMIDGVFQEIVPAVTDPVFYEKKGFQAPTGLEVAEENVSDDLKAFGMRLVVPKGTAKRIRLITRRSFFELPDSFEYSLSFIKQAGTLPYPLTITLQTENAFVKTGSQVLFNGEADRDMEFTSKIQKASR